MEYSVHGVLRLPMPEQACAAHWAAKRARRAQLLEHRDASSASGRNYCQLTSRPHRLVVQTLACASHDRGCPVVNHVAQGGQARATQGGTACPGTRGGRAKLERRLRNGMLVEARLAVVAVHPAS